MPEAFYDQLDEDLFRPTRWSSGPWDPANQHGGPPSALLGRAVQRCRRSDAMVARLTVELLGPVPVGAPLRARAQVSRAGRNVELVTAELATEARPVARAAAWRVRTEALELPAGPPGPQRPPPIPPTADRRAAGTEWDRGYLAAVEWRFVAGHFLDQGPASVWTRLRVALVAGEEPTPLQRVLAVADSGSGVSNVLPLHEWLYINPELTVHLHRHPVGEWVLMQASTTIEPHGVGLAESVLSDERGPIGRGAQSLLVGPRPG